MNRQYSLEIAADIRKYATEMAKIPGVTDKQAAAAARRMERHMARQAAATLKTQTQAAKRSARAWESFTSRLTFAITPTDLVNLGKAAVDFGQRMADINNRLADTSARTGIAVNTIKGLDLAFKGSGLEAGNVETILNRFPKVLGDVARGTGDALPALERLFGEDGFDAEGALRNTDGALRDILEQLAKVPDTGEQAALAMQIFGKQGGQILQSGLLASSDALAAFEGHAARWGTETGPQAAAAAAQFQRAAADLDMVLEGLPSKFTDAFGIDMTETMRSFTEGVVVGFESVIAASKVTGLALLAVQESVEALAGGEGLAGVSAAFERFEQDSIDLTRVHTEAINEFRKTRGEIDGLGQSTRDTSEESEDLGTKLGEQQEQHRRAAAAARAHAQELSAVQTEMQRLAGANEIYFGGDEARRDQQLRQLDELSARIAAQGMTTVETETEISRARLKVWEDYYAAVDAEAADAEAEEVKRWEERLAAEEEMLEAQRQQREAYRAQELEREQEHWDIVTTIQGAAFDAASQLVDAFGMRRLDAAARIREQLADEEAQLTAQQRAELEAQLADEQRKASRSHKLSKALGASEAIISGLIAGVAALRPPPVGYGPTPLGLAAGAAAAATGIATGIAIAAQPAPVVAHRGTDDVPATLRPGEAVLTPAAADRLGRENIRAANSGSGGGGGQVVQVDFNLRGQTLQTMTTDTMKRPGEARTQARGFRVGQSRHRR